MEPTVSNILAGLILTGILWLAKSINDHGKDLTQIKTLLTGINGDNGINSDVKGLVTRTTDLERKHDLLEQRVEQLEKPA